VDALDPAEAERLRDLGRLFPAVPLVIGETSGATKLEAGVVYNRYGVPILVEESLRDYLEEGLPPFLFSSPGGIFARINGELLRSLREARNLSLGALAGVAGVSRRTIQLYEEGAGAEVDVVERIEQFLGEPVAQPIDIFRPPGPSKLAPAAKAPVDASRRRRGKNPPEGAGGRAVPASTGDPMRDGVFRQLGGMGWDVVVTLRCPFDAFSRGVTMPEREILLTAVGTLRSARHRAEVLNQLARVAEGHALFVVRETLDRMSIDGLPLVTVTELRGHRDPGALVDLISERENV
ncbi:MAG: helix-turn-helix domain-containing protein, partial [Thermoplasmata archaeon]|nr:helix-turn-helix domain-containing protein [Thermoplasmata archaeon]